MRNRKQTEKINALVVEIGMYGRGFALMAKETEKATSYVREAELFIQRLADEMNKKNSAIYSANNQKLAHMAIMQIADCAFKMDMNAFNATVEAARSGKPDF